MRARRRDVWIAAALGFALAGAALGYLAASDRKRELLLVLAVEVAAGREASIPAGLAAGLDWPTVALVVLLIELTSLFALFPLLVGLAAGLHRIRWLEGHLRRAQAFAARRPDVDALALGALTLMPFLPVGALTSVLVAELVRLPSRYVLPVLAGALVLANVGVAWATARVLSYLPHPQLVAAAMAGLLLVGAGLAWLWHKRTERRERTAEGLP